MARVYFPCGSMSIGGNYKAGSMPPEGYIASQEWDAVQRKAGLRQVQCEHCCLWQYPQEIASQREATLRNGRGKAVIVTAHTCKKCAALKESPNA